MKSKVHSTKIRLRNWLKYEVGKVQRHQKKKTETATRAMKSIVYDADSPSGIKMTQIPRPHLYSSVYDQSALSWTRFVAFQAITVLFWVCEFMMAFIRIFFPWVPPPYGVNSERKWVLVKVAFVGLNPGSFFFQR